MTSSSRVSSTRFMLVAVVILAAWAMVHEFDFSQSPTFGDNWVRPLEQSTHQVQTMSVTKALSPGELPGYTGWGRPEATLARFFTIQSVSTETPIVGQPFSIRLICKGNEECSRGSSLFYLRAYGPSVIPGIVQETNKKEGRYVVEFVFPDRGLYTLEVVLTFSNPPPMGKFPLVGMDEPAYEGYLLPGFPLLVTVQANEDVTHLVSTALCDADVLVETSPLSALSKARWTVQGKPNDADYTPKGNEISESGYKNNPNSIGIQMSYDVLTPCRMLSLEELDPNLNSKHPLSKCGKNLHVIFVGDSVMRVQKVWFDTLIEPLSNVATEYINLYGGFRRVQAQSKNLDVQLREIQTRSAGATVVVLFNSGLHDIHRLCGNEWKDDRYEYMDRSQLDSGTFSCTEEYRSVVKDLASKILAYPADLRIFQTTTAAWPKYGNFGIEWPMDGQIMPVTVDAIPPFNEIAFDVLQEFRDSIDIVDGFWVTYSRPDNREIGAIGNKLSHPGLEVQRAMCRIWTMLLLERLCKE
eukprot:Nitzschia sp. Nitz4//scaffold86_size83305//22380//23954//NITZ4_005252-RA/size83305-exonerate_est2genome-gene-0.43-mRNA-1//-1//CDS//3329559220//8352//frame0